MQTDRQAIRRMPLFVWVMLTLLAAALLWWLTSGSDREERGRPDLVVVETTAAPSLRPQASDRPAAPVPASVSTPEAAFAHIRQAYPMFGDATLTCNGAQCVLAGTVTPVATQAGLDKRQEMLLGGLAASLAADGYMLSVPFAMDEFADNTFRLRAMVTRDAGSGDAS